ncbi:MAG: bifunctional phosphopantothenoylcysteine decarboxylase/phosphopantothenate--cysteine ligase CoaBC [Lachnospiraceae bacterium]|nr:bifunctional phosphopantothenoylcysteine decarboxylase/phosphopantothenate--cysteine ligase CoaBC [Lachnospiraceae bacterium]
MQKGKTVVLAVTGSIAAYKMANVARMLKKINCNVQVLMTKNATQFINPITFESLTGNKCLIDTFDRNFQYSVEHVALAKQADVVLAAPASANVIGKLAGGLADDMLTTTILACPCPKLIAPAMNHHMYHNPIVQDNLQKLSHFGYQIIPPETGMLANGDMGDGRMPEEAVLVDYVLREIAFEKDLAGKRVLVTAGATREALDPVRFITNHSSGKMGCALARAASLRGAQVTLVAAHMEVEPPRFVENVPVVSAEDMFQAVTERSSEADFIIKAAAVADYTPETVADGKIKKADGEFTLRLKRTRDILKYLGEHKRPGQVLCGFSMETDQVLENSRKKLASKNCDLICANSLRTAGAGFGVDTNVLTLITVEEEQELELMSKEEAAHRVLDVMKKIAVPRASV